MRAAARHIVARTCLPPMLDCDSHENTVENVYMWMSGGNTHSKIHYDPMSVLMIQLGARSRSP